MDSVTGPVWTEKPQRVSRQNPVGVTTTRNRPLLNDLLYPFFSDAITYRLRYLSFWAWCLDNLDAPSKTTRAQFEKIFFLANIAHDCPDDGHSTNGIVGAERKIDDEYLADKYTPDTSTFDLTENEFELTSSAGSGFDTYYHSLLQRLWLIDGKFTLTPLGQQLAEAFDDAVQTEFDELHTAVETGQVSQELIQRFATDGCCCLLQAADSERELLTGAVLSCITRTDTPHELAFKPVDGPDELSLETWYPRDLATNDGTTIDIESLFDSEEDETNLGEYVHNRLGDRGRASVLLFLGTAARVQKPPAATEWDMPTLSDIRRAWQLFVYTHYFVVACEGLLKAWLHGLRAWELISTSRLLDRVFNADDYIRTIRSVAADDVAVTVDESNPDQLWRVLDAVYYGNWYKGSIELEHQLPSDFDQADGDELTWGTLRTSLPAECSDTGFGVGSASARVLHDLLQSNQSGLTDAERAHRLAGYATVLLTRLHQRGQTYAEDEAFDPYRTWFNHIESSPSPSYLWRQDPGLDASSPVASFMKTFTKNRIVAKHHRITQRKIRDHPSQTARHMTRRPDGQWEFKSMYKTSHLEQSWLRIERLTDILYELDLTTSPNRDEFTPNDRGQRVFERYGIQP
ncbi:hypothetical protein [Halorussus pelagicus]|uniref:hypothetical protein n=1 Tax=Halorussus pelagicus TaxID=2505977 RepID=UPI000FFC0FFC|nr:hypothetical protein [Halorussus pelagicus]